MTQTADSFRDRILASQAFAETLEELRADPGPMQPPSDPFADDWKRVHFDAFAKRRYSSARPPMSEGLSEPTATTLEKAIKATFSTPDKGPTPDRGGGATPHYHLLWPILERNLRDLSPVLRAQAERPRVEIAYSIKTNPMPSLLQHIRNAGLSAEAITGDEIAHAVRQGFPTDRIIVNGPGKFWKAGLPGGPPGRSREGPPDETVDTVFADNPEDLEDLFRHFKTLEKPGKEKPLTRVLGLRLRPASVTSRFGLAVTDPAVRTMVIDILKAIGGQKPIGFHFHIASAYAGEAGWWWLCAEFLETVAVLCEAADCEPDTLDFGGGWRPGAWGSFLHQGLARLKDRISERLPSVKRIILEPGSALVQETMVLETRILRVNKIHGRREVICDGSLAELWTEGVPRRLFRLGRQGPEEIGAGPDVLFGRLCMEPDVLIDGIGFPPDLAAGDRLLVSDVGAYAYSGAFPFGSGIAYGDISSPPGSPSRSLPIDTKKALGSEQ